MLHPGCSQSHTFASTFLFQRLRRGKKPTACCVRREELVDSNELFMQIRLADAVSLPTQAVEYLSDHIIRFQLECWRQPSAYQRFFLDDHSSPDEFLPTAPNRAGVQHNLTALAARLDMALPQMRDRPFGERSAILSRSDFLMLQIDHFCRPTYLYTNGQALVSLVQRRGTTFEVGYHRSLAAFLDFCSESSAHAFLEAEDLQIAGSLEDAEKAARARLSTVQTWTLNLRRGIEIEQLVMQPAGSRRDDQGYREETLLADLQESQFRVTMGGGPCGKHEPYRVLNQLRPNGFVIEACATCVYFRFSGMTRDMSAGSVGYCKFPLTKEPRSELIRVSVRYVCPEYTFIADQNREHPYLRD